MPLWARLRTYAALASFGLTVGGSAQFAAAQSFVSAAPPTEDAPPVLRMAEAPAGTGAEAVPDVTIPPNFPSPNAAVTLPSNDGAVSLNKAAARFTLLAGRGNDLGMDMIDGEATLGFRDLDSFTITPSAGAVFLDGPTRTDLPPRLYTGQVEFRWFGQIATPVFYEVAFLPALFTDGNNLDDALRLQGRGVGYLALSEQTQLVLGATYLDRDDVPILPVFGVLHSPRDDLKLELVFPRPRILKRVSQVEDTEAWAYAAGELGGGSWAIERANGRDDTASYRDYRFLLGLEQKRLKMWAAAIEAGYVFGRELEYASGRGDYAPSSTLILRLALSH
jgi:hypothetical protein